MEREKDEVVQRKAQLEQVRKLYHAARDYAGTDEKLYSSRRTRPPRRRSSRMLKMRKLRSKENCKALKEKMFKASQELFDLRQIEASTA